jgi:hypothetical protein
LRNILTGLAVAGVTALLMAVPTIRGISTWKVVLGVIGLTIFLLADRK